MLAAEGDVLPRPAMERRNVFNIWTTQMEALLGKTVKLLGRKYMFLLFSISFPAVCVLILYWLNLGITATDLQPVPVELTKCERFNAYGNVDRTEDLQPCITVMYTPDDNDNVTMVMKDVAASTGLTWGVDVVASPSPRAAARYAIEHIGVVDAVVNFHANFSWDQVEYNMWVNESAALLYASAGKDNVLANQGYLGRALGLQTAVDAGIVSRVTTLERGVGAGKTAKFDYRVGGFTPVNENLFDSGNVPIVQLSGATFMVLGPVVVALMLLNQVTTEKHGRLLGALRVAGLWESTHWISWFLASTVVLVPGSLVALLVGEATNVYLFSKVAFAVHALSLIMFGFAMCAFVLWIGSFVTQPRWANTASFLTFAAAVIVSFMFSSMQMFDSMYAPSKSFMVKLIMWFQPWFHYGKIIADLLFVIHNAPHKTSPSHGSGSGSGSGSGPHDAFAFDYADAAGLGTSDASSDASSAMGASAGGGHGLGMFTWADLTNEVGPFKDRVNGAAVEFYAPAPSYNIAMLGVLSVIYLTFAWWFGQVFSGDLGASQSADFACRRKYWRVGKARARAHGEEAGGSDDEDGSPMAYIEGDTLAMEREMSRRDESVRVHKLSKAYDKVSALKEVSLSMDKGELFGVLGVNGAGKTTMVGCIGGLLTPTYGEAFLFGHSVRDDIAYLRTVMGHCPQHDTLYPELTGRAHLQLYARFKGVSRSAAADHVNRLLDLVNLSSDGDKPVSTYSGGMCRRLSVAISAVASPRIIFLDEPTTGMDPLSRLRVHELIRFLKQDRIVVLTTHSMEEADSLSDKIGIIAQGRVRAVGTSLFLKSRFGAGYQINVLAGPDSVDTIKELVAAALPGAEIVGDAAGNLTVGVPRRSTTFVPAFLRRLESYGKEVAKEWGISNSTLEEVFLRLAAQQSGVNEVQADFREDAPLGGAGPGAHVGAPGAPAMPAGPRACVLCAAAPAEPVTVYTGKGVSVVAPDLICARCSNLTDAELAELLHRERGTRGDELPVHTHAEGVGATGTVAGTASSASMAAAPTTVGASAAAGATAAAAAAPNPHVVDKLGMAREASGLAAPPAYGSHAAHGSAHGPGPHGAGAGAGAGAGPRRGLMGPDGEPVPAEPVSMGTHMMAVLKMRLTLHSKQRKTIGAQAVLLMLGMLVTWAVSPAPPNHSDLCPGGYVSNRDAHNEAFGWQACNTTSFEDYMTGVYGPLPKGGGSGSGSGGGGGGDEPYGTGSRIVQYMKLYKEQCVKYDTNGGCFWNGYVEMPDWTQMQAANYGNLYWDTMPPGVTVWYKDATGPGDVPFKTYDALGAGKGVLNITGVARYLHYPESSNFDDILTNVQETIKEKSSPLGGTPCNQYGWNGNSGYYMGDDYIVAREWVRKTFPDFTLAFTANQPDELRFGVDLTTYAPAVNYDNTMVYTSMNSSSGAWGPGTPPQCQQANMQSPGPNWQYPDNGCSGSGCQINMPIAAAMNALHSSVLRTVAGPGKDGLRQLRVSLAAFPAFDFVPAVQPIELGFQAFLFPLFALFLLPSFTSQIVTERETKLYQMMRTEGMSVAGYWSGVYAYQLVASTILSAYLVVLGYMFSLRTFTNASPLLFVAVMLAWGHAQTGLTYLMAAVFNRSRVASIICYMTIFVVSIASGVLDLAWTRGAWPVGLLFFPPIAFARSALLVLLYGGDVIHGDTELATSLLLLTLVGTACLLVGVYLHAVVPSASGTSEGLFYPLEQLWDAMCTRSGRRARHAQSSVWNRVELRRSGSGGGMRAGGGPGAPSEPLLGGDAGKGAPGGRPTRSGSSGGAPGALGGYGAVAEAAMTGAGGAAVDILTTDDEDVAGERDRVLRGLPGNTAVVIRHLRKVYGDATDPAAKVAVEDLCMAISYGECFCLLGPNGAGKTTTISMLCGALNPSAGACLVGGYDTATEMNKVYRVLGVAPQFDTVWGDLNVADHLLFYARLKGVDKVHETAAVQRTAEKIGLDGDAFHMAASTLSGGQLRRLSVGIALIGDSPIVLLDEPTTGLDPESRRGVWDIIQAEKAAGRALLVSTHNMEEADTLATRIGIMAFGNLRCIGTQLHLKNKFGQGYRLQLSLADDTDENFEHTVAFVHANVSADVRVSARTGKTVQLVLPRSGVDVPALFQTFESRGEEARIADFAVSQTSLEEVFVAVVKTAEADESGGAAAAAAVPGGGGGGAAASAGGAGAASAL